MHDESEAASSVTVRLPPAKPHVVSAGFALEREATVIEDVPTLIDGTADPISAYARHAD
jgi:hypothetical protein